MTSSRLKTEDVMGLALRWDAKARWNEEANTDMYLQVPDMGKGKAGGYPAGVFRV